ncbi:MAG: patatin-like phospholipase family protein [Rhodanobacter sp.]
MRGKPSLLIIALLLAGCQTAPRLPAPPDLIGTAVPVGFSSDVRLVTTDGRSFAALAPGFFGGLHAASNDGSLNILALSGGGSGGAYGAGVLAGMTRAHARPSFEMVTGVSAGALLAPFAFLGSDWDARMREAFTGERSARLLRSPTRTVLSRLLSPRGLPHHNALFRLVDHFVTPQMVAAVARESASGRRLVVATTDLDKHETVLWNLGEIAQHGGPAARRLFRDVLIASASVPGVYPPVLIRVREGGRDYDEMHVDGGVTTSVFSMPLIAGIQSTELPLLRGANLYMLVNGQLARAPQTTPYNTVDIIANALAAEMTYKTREAIVDNIAASHRLGMHFHLTEIPVDYPQTSFIDFEQTHMLALFDYAAGCAAQGLVWMTPTQSLRRNMSARSTGVSSQPACPAAPMAE